MLRLEVLCDRLPESEGNWNLAQRTVHERSQRLANRLKRLVEIESSCRDQLAALEAIMLDEALTGDYSGALDHEHNELMAAVNEALVDAQNELSAADEIDGLGDTNVADLRRHRAASTRAPERR
ncbi:MAG: hypothetical protein UY76_C0046G0001 [Candidatus Uhrbacteria bacterium GW2011_GWA2_52_8d]|uniref:Uncharacterized protein n=1 Tax=Candidatus Uhrbacteria bacterium GW2011_GWA2_52_8d TaxID=1618979 RepID=A0A0G1ZUA1_9BACT|nr:MAG: hypothetical protein UY76_C0046G0001 [Candidatus Uhrbacteria bacterium GW2011_GWA2_52_8d]